MERAGTGRKRRASGFAAAAESSAASRPRRDSSPPAAAAAAAAASAVAVAAASSSAASAAASSREAIVARPSRPTLYGPTVGPNLLLGLQSRTMGLFPPSHLRSHVVSRRLSTLALAQSKEIISPHKHSINALDMDHTEARYLLSCGGEGLIAVYDVADRLNKRGYIAKPVQLRKSRSREMAVGCIQWYPFDTGMFVSGGADGKVSVWDTNTFETVQTFKMAGIVHALKMSHAATTHSLIATGTADSNVRLCDMASGAYSHTLHGHTDEVLSLDWSPTNEFTLVTGSADNMLRVWDIRRAGTLMVLDKTNRWNPPPKQIGPKHMHFRSNDAAHNGAVTGVSWMAEGAQILSSGVDRKMRLWDARTGRNTHVAFEGLTAVPRTSRFSVSCDSSSVYVPNDLLVHEYSVRTGQLLRAHRGHFERVLCCATNPVTQDVYSAGMDRHILVWTPRDDERSYEADDEEEEKASAVHRQRELEAQDMADREAQLRIMQSVFGPNSASPSSGQRADEDAWSDDEFT